MYLVKNALRCIGRSKGRNVLIGVIVLVISISSCIGLSIRQAAEHAKEETLSNLSVTATISFDRSSAMHQMAGNQGEKGFDHAQFSNMMGNAASLSLEEYQKYAGAASVKDFYYSMTAYVNGADALSPVSDESDETDAASSETAAPGGKGMMGGGGAHSLASNSDFSLIGYGSENAMRSFMDGTASMVEGAVFSADSDDGSCIITQELAMFNDLAVGDTISLCNPQNEAEVYELVVTGIYTDTAANTDTTGNRFRSPSDDPANKILISYPTLARITSASEAAETAAAGSTDEENSVAPISGMLTGTYVFSDVASYEAFEPEARALGLSEDYTVSSSDLSAFENSLIPLNTLSKMAGYFLVVLLIIGASILVVLNIFNVRERKYEIGVLTAMGMKKGKVALQFLTEIFVVTLISVLLGAGIGAVSSVPVTNTLLEGQVASQNEQANQVQQRFGKGEGGQNNPLPGNNGFRGMLGVQEAHAYVTEIGAATDLTVVLQLLAIGLFLTLISGMVSMLFVMRYEPLQILANRD